MDLSSNIRAFVSQRLVPGLDGKRVAAVEVLLGTPTIQELILRGEFESIKEVMEKSENLGMQTFDGALFKLYCAERISADEALKNADSANNVRLKIKFRDQGAVGSDGKMNLSLQSIQDDEEI
jgi:twitching motility protein PilU